MKLKAIIPLFIFVALSLLLLATLDRDTRLVPSPLIDKLAPNTALTTLADNAPFSPEQMQGKRWIMNVWASWCVACRQEHDLLLQLAKQPDVHLVGYNYKDTPDKAAAWLQQLGDPYSTVVQDMEGQAGLDWGIYGVPETYLIDESNHVRYKHVGPLDTQTVVSVILPFLANGEVRAVQ